MNPGRVASGIGARTQWARLAGGVVGFALLFAVAEAFTRSHVVDPKFLPAASVVLTRVAEILVDPDFLAQVGATLQAWALGLGLSVAVAVPLGIVLGASRVAYAASQALIDFLRPIPAVALIPVAILVFGQNTQMKVFLVVMACLWPVLFNTIYGVHAVDPVAKATARSYGLGRVKVLARVALPSAAPFIFTGIRISASIALLIAISAELLTGGENGIGSWMLRQGETGTRPDLVYAGTVVTGLLGVVINLLMVSAERRYLGWQPALRARR